MDALIKKTILVTGAAGFIGSHATDRLLEQGHRVIAVDNLKLGRMSNLQKALENEKFTFIEADLNDLQKVLELLRPLLADGLDAVWHLAANSDIKSGAKDANIDLQDTFMTTFNTLAVMKEFGAGELVFASTSAIYGEKAGVLSEDMGPLFPISSYGAMKLASEGIITAALESFLKHVWMFRFPNVVGSRATHGAIYDFVRKLKENPKELEVLGDGTQIKPYLHVSELLDAIFFAIQKSQDRLNYFNIGQTSSRSTVQFIAESVVKAVSPDAHIAYTGGSRGWVGDVPQFELSIEKIGKLGWKPKMTSDQSVVLAVSECI
jgi:UDP-glucose 4-epimerase